MQTALLQGDVAAELVEDVSGDALPESSQMHFSAQDLLAHPRVRRYMSSAYADLQLRELSGQTSWSFTHDFLLTQYQVCMCVLGEEGGCIRACACICACARVLLHTLSCMNVSMYDAFQPSG